MTNTNSTRSAEIAHAREVDSRIAAAWDLYWEADAKLAPFHDALRRLRSRLNRLGAADLRAKVQAEIDETSAKLQARYVAEAEPLRVAAQKLDADLYEGWNRFFLVKHIHKSQHCSSFRPTTRIGWLPDVSGLTEAEAVAEHGAILCTVCFPTAPVEFTRGAEVDPSLCAGSGQYAAADSDPKRLSAYYSPSGKCPVCGQVVTLTSRGSGKVRKHKKPEA